MSGLTKLLGQAIDLREKAYGKRKGGRERRREEEGKGERGDNDLFTCYIAHKHKNWGFLRYVVVLLWILN